MHRVLQLLENFHKRTRNCHKKEQQPGKEQPFRKCCHTKKRASDGIAFNRVRVPCEKIERNANFWRDIFRCIHLQNTSNMGASDAKKRGGGLKKGGVKECGVWHKGLSPIGACKPISSRQNCYYGKRLHNAIYIFHTRKSNWILWP